MKKELIVSHEDDETKIALLEDGRLFELHEEFADNAFVVGDIFLGRVKKLAPNLMQLSSTLVMTKMHFCIIKILVPTFCRIKNF